MKGHVKYLLKGFLLLIITFYIISIINAVLKPKYLYDDMWPTTQTYVDFYEVDKNTIDVLFLGSSHFVTAFSPLDIYQEYNICSYNLGCEQQNLLVSYYWLQEALKYQNPKVVVLDTHILFPYRIDEALNSEEVATRKALDFMKWSPNKISAISDICNIDDTQEWLNYMLSNFRYHSRWESFSQNDITFYTNKENKHGLMGYSMLEGQVFDADNDQYYPISENNEAPLADPVETMKIYLDKIVELCKKNNIQLILCNTPFQSASEQKYNYVSTYAKQQHIDYIDFNEQNLYKEIGYHFSNDNYDAGHINKSGAKKISSYMGKYLIENYHIPNKENKLFETDLKDAINNGL